MRGRCPYPQTTIGRLEMKKMLMGAASVIALSIAAPAFAQSTSTVNQSNTGNGAVVDQTGSLSGGDSLVNQSGASNSANVTQADDGSGATPQNASDLEQTGDSNPAQVNQDTSTLHVQSTPSIAQPGARNQAGLPQQQKKGGNKQSG